MGKCYAETRMNCHFAFGALYYPHIERWKKKLRELKIIFVQIDARVSMCS